MIRNLAALLLTAGLAAAPVAVPAQTAAPADAVPPPTFSRTFTPADATFVSAMWRMGQTQIALAQLAQQRSHSAQTRNFARNTETEWVALTQRLAAIAEVQGLPTPAASAAQAVRDRLAAVSDGSFDSAYMTMAGRADQRALNSMQAERRSGNPALVALVNDYLHWFTTAVAVTSAQSPSPDAPSEE